MHELFSELITYAQAATRYKWLAIAVAWIICVAGWVYVSQLPDQYTATARVHVDTRSLLRPLLRGMTIQPDIHARVALMTKLMFSRANLEKVARMTDMDLGSKTEKDMDRLVNRLKSSMRIAAESKDNSNLYRISSHGSDPKLAKRIVQAILTIFVEETLGETRKDSDTAQRFLSQQLREYEERLIAADQEREAFKRKNYGLMPDQGGDQYGLIQSTQKQLEEARLRLKEALHRRDEIQRQLDSEKPVLNEIEIPDGPLDARIRALQERLDELLLRYTKGHPDVITTRKQINQLQRKKYQQASSEEGAYNNPIFQQIKIAQSEADAEVASLQTRVAAYEQKIKDLGNQLDMRLKIETEMKNLNRDYSTIKSNYDNLLSRRETVRFTEAVEQNTEAVRFRVLNPAKAPSKPSGPKRILLSTGVLIVGVGAGAGLAVLLALLRPTFASDQKLRDITGLPILGSVSMNWIPEIRQRKWHEFLGFCSVCVALLLALAGVIVFEINGVNLHSLAAN